MKHRQLISALLLCGVFWLPPQTALGKTTGNSIFPGETVEKFYRTELYFGADKPGGGTVSPEEWNAFLAGEVTARFPAGFTVLDGYGQYKDESGRVVRENSRVLILFYAKRTRKEVNAKIEELRSVYKTRFRQESVLRLDFTKSVEVSF